jgi:hypothetical protein
MDVHTIQQLAKARHDDLVRDADEWRVARLARESHEDACPAPLPIPRPRAASRLGLAR